MRRFSNAPPDWAFPDRDSEDSSVEDVALPLAVVSSSPLNPTPDGERPRIALRSLKDVAAKPLEWVFDRVIPRGALTLLAGDSGVGKSRFAVGLIAAVLRGQPGPRCRVIAGTDDRGLEESLQEPNREATSRIPANANDDDSDLSVRDVPRQPVMPAVVVFSSEQTLTDSIRPRLMEARADLSRVFALCGIDDSSSDDADWGTGHPNDSDADSDSVPHERGLRPWSFQLKHDLPILAEELKRLQAEGVNVRMIVIDPVDGYLESQQRRLLVDAEISQLAELAKQTGIAILAVSNSGTAETVRFSRRPGRFGIEALSKVARFVWTIVRDLEVANRRMLIPIKQVGGVDPAGFAYSLRNGMIDWDPEPVTISGDDYLAEAAIHSQSPLAREYQYEKDRAAAWLYERLSGGRVASLIVHADAEENEISIRTLRRAFKSLGCRTNRERGKGRHGQWFWRLPGEGYFYRAGAPRLVGQQSHAVQDVQQIETPAKQGFDQ